MSEINNARWTSDHLLKPGGTALYGAQQRERLRQMADEVGVLLREYRADLENIKFDGDKPFEARIRAYLASRPLAQLESDLRDAKSRRKARRRIPEALCRAARDVRKGGEEGAGEARRKGPANAPRSASPDRSTASRRHSTRRPVTGRGSRRRPARTAATTPPGLPGKEGLISGCPALQGPGGALEQAPGGDHHKQGAGDRTVGPGPPPGRRRRHGMGRPGPAAPGMDPEAAGPGARLVTLRAHHCSSSPLHSVNPRAPTRAPIRAREAPDP
ncbi:hypothetical protein LT493_26090 [Streptomyces tricolor]|nr:hypothetical protein [Streptomyces tricolor]